MYRSSGWKAHFQRFCMLHEITDEIYEILLPSLPSNNLRPLSNMTPSYARWAIIGNKDSKYMPWQERSCAMWETVSHLLLSYFKYTQTQRLRLRNVYMHTFVERQTTVLLYNMAALHVPSYVCRATNNRYAVQYGCTTCAFKHSYVCRATNNSSAVQYGCTTCTFIRSSSDKQQMGCTIRLHHMYLHTFVERQTTFSTAPHVPSYVRRVTRRIWVHYMCLHTFIRSSSDKQQMGCTLCVHHMYLHTFVERLAGDHLRLIVVVRVVEIVVVWAHAEPTRESNQRLISPRCCALFTTTQDLV